MITMRNIIFDGHPNLNKVSAPVRIPMSFADKRLARNLHQYIVNSQDPQISEQYSLREAVGISAPQVNILKRMFAVYFRFEGVEYSYVVVNPEYTFKSEEMTYLPGGEGCLSVDYDTEGLTPRHWEIEMKFLSLNLETSKLEPMTLRLEGYPAIVFQHEFDHLEGILYVSKLFPELPDLKPAFEIVAEEEE